MHNNECKDKIYKIKKKNREIWGGGIHALPWRVDPVIWDLFIFLTSPQTFPQHFGLVLNADAPFANCKLNNQRKTPNNFYNNYTKNQLNETLQYKIMIKFFSCFVFIYVFYCIIIIIRRTIFPLLFY